MDLLILLILMCMSSSAYAYYSIKNSKFFKIWQYTPIGFLVSRLS